MSTSCFTEEPVPKKVKNKRGANQYSTLEANKTFQCDMCEKKFMSTNSLRVHKKFNCHDKIKAFFCELCGKNYSRKQKNLTNTSMLFMKRKKIISVKFVAKVFLGKTHVGNMKSSCMVIYQNFNVNIVAILPKPNLSSMHIIRESTNTRLTNSYVTKCTMESNVNCRFRLEPTFISKFTSYFFH